MMTIVVNTLIDENDGITLGGFSLPDAIAPVLLPVNKIALAPNIASSNTIRLTQGQLTVSSFLKVDRNNSNMTVDYLDPSPVKDNNTNFNSLALPSLTATGSNIKSFDLGSQTFQPLNLNTVNTINPSTIVVNTLIDENDGIAVGRISLRDAIAAANPGDTIVFAPELAGGRIKLVEGQLTIAKSLIIDGNGSNITVDAGGTSRTRVFNIDDDNNNNLNSVTLAGLTITGGNMRNFGVGGGILSYENLTLINSTIAYNQANGGGGIAIWTRQLINRNTTYIINSTIHHNSANSGGGLDVDTSLVNVINTTIAHNSVTSGGGGIFNNGDLNLTNSTISYNVGGKVFKGGGVDSTFGGTVYLSNTIIAANQDNEDFTTTSAPFVRSGGNNLIGNGDGLYLLADGVNSDRIGTSLNPIDPLLGPLQNNGGNTLTIALLPGSLAIDAGSNNFLPPDTFDLNLNGNLNEFIPFDARGLGFSRVVNNSVDLGAFELQNNIPIVNPLPPPILTSTF